MDSPVTYRQASMMLTLIWLELLDRKGQLSEQTITLLGLHFAPHFSAQRTEVGDIEYKLEAITEVGAADTILVHQVIPAPAGNKHLRLNMNLKPIQTFVREAHEAVRRAIEADFPVLRPEQVKTSFAYEADRLIREQTNEDHDAGSD